MRRGRRRRRMTWRIGERMGVQAAFGRPDFPEQARAEAGDNELQQRQTGKEAKRSAPDNRNSGCPRVQAINPVKMPENAMADSDRGQDAREGVKASARIAARDAP